MVQIIEFLLQEIVGFSLFDHLDQETRDASLRMETHQRETETENRKTHIRSINKNTGLKCEERTYIIETRTKSRRWGKRKSKSSSSEHTIDVSVGVSKKTSSNSSLSPGDEGSITENQIVKSINLDACILPLRTATAKNNFVVHY